ERATGHLGFMPFLLLPWLAYFYLRALQELRWALAAGGVIAYAVFAGGPYPFVMFCVYVGLLVIFDLGRLAAARQWRALARPPSIGLVAAAVAVGLSAIKLGPVVDFMSEYPREVMEHDYLAPWQVW